MAGKVRMVLVALLTSGAAAADAADPSTRVLDDLTACRGIAADAQRLACFDRAAAAVASQRGSGKLMVFDRDKVEAERRTSFGLADPPAGAGASEGTRAAADAAAVRTLTSTVTAVAPAAGTGRWTMTLANGQVWQMLGNSRVEPRKGATVRLSTTVTGGIRAAVDGRAPVQVRRIR